MKKKIVFIVTLFLFSLNFSLSNADECSKFDKLTKEYAKCNAELIKKKTNKTIEKGKKKFNSFKLKDTLIKFKESKSHKEFMEKMKNDN